MATRKERVKKSLETQLKRKNANVFHFQKLIEDYCNLFEIKDKLQQDVCERGVTIDEYNSKGFEVHKTNPSIGELEKAQVTMLKILDKLEITVDGNIEDVEEDEDGL